MKKLLDDFYNLIANNKNSNHFLGIIIDYNAGKVDKTEKYYVIDGQQAYLNDPQNKTRDITNIGTHILL